MPKTKSYVSLLILLLLSALTNIAQAGNKCTPEMLADLANDSTRLKNILNADSGKPEPKKNNLDLHFFKPDRTDKILKQFNSGGILQNAAVPDRKDAGGSAILINECYVLTARHVVERNLSDIGDKLAVGEVQHFHAGANNLCDRENPFALAGLKATIVDFGGSDKPKTYSYIEDWVLLKLEKPIKDFITPALPSKITMESGQLLYRSGYPGTQIRGNDPWGLAAIRVQQIQVVDPDDLATKVTYDERTHGMSGGGAFFISRNSNGEEILNLHGINVTKDSVLPMRIIFRGMNMTGRDSQNEIARAKTPGTCD